MGRMALRMAAEAGPGHRAGLAATPRIKTILFASANGAQGGRVVGGPGSAKIRDEKSRERAFRFGWANDLQRHGGSLASAYEKSLEVKVLGANRDPCAKPNETNVNTQSAEGRRLMNGKAGRFSFEELKVKSARRGGFERAPRQEDPPPGRGPRSQAKTMRPSRCTTLACWLGILRRGGGISPENQRRGCSSKIQQFVFGTREPV